MNLFEFEKAKELFRIKSLEKEYSKLYNKRKATVKTFTKNRLANLLIDDYVQGKGNRDSFCYILERDLAELGNITGSTAIKFGVYYDKHNKEYAFSKKYGSNYKEAFKNIKKYILELLEAGEHKDLEAIVKNPISTMFKGKILSTYFPEDYLNIFAEEHLDHYLKMLDLDTKILMSKDPIYKRQALLEFKNADKDMRNWSVNMFAVFLWGHYPKAPIKDGETAIECKERIDFPTPDKIGFVNMEQTFQERTKNELSHIIPPADYEKEARIHKVLGDRGEYMVLMAEIERVAKELSISTTEAKKKIKRVSLESDSYGYDILSVNEDGTPRYIEVKATQRKCGNIDFYYTAHELSTAHKYRENYFIYIVYEIMTSYPKIWILGNPFIKNNSLELQPVKYKVKVCAEKKK